MAFLVDILNDLASGFFELLFWPFRGFDPFWALLFVSVASGVLFVWIFGLVSDQERIRILRNRIRGNLLGIRLYRHEISVVAGLQGSILTDVGRYAMASLKPMIFLLIPVVFILAQLNLNLSVRPLLPGESTLVKARLDSEERLDQAIGLNITEGLEVETPGVRIHSLREIAWRVKALKEGEFEVNLKVGGESFGKKVIVGKDWNSTPTLRTQSWLMALLYPGEDLLSSGDPVRSIEVLYPDLRLQVVGWNLDWLIFYFLVSIVFGFLVKGFLGVEV